MAGAINNAVFNIISLVRAGREATRVVPGLKRLTLRGFAINLVVYFVLIAGLNLLFYHFAHRPALEWVLQRGAPWMVITGRILLWFIQFGMALASVVFSVRVSLKLMGFWFEVLAAKVVFHFRPGEDKPLKLRDSVMGLVGTARDLVKDIFITMGLMVLSLVPVIGAPLVFLIGSHLMGRSVKQPYEAVCKGLDSEQGRERRPVSTFALGWGQMLLAVIPVIGWVLLPMVTIYQVIGYAYALEREASGEVGVEA